MKASEAFPGAYLRAADLGPFGTRVLVTIASVKTEDLGDEHKQVATFVGKTKGLVLNKTNWNMLAEISGEDDDDMWAGVKVTLYTDKTDFQGKRVDCIRVDYPKVHPATKPRVVAPAPAQDDVESEGEESVPF